MRDALQDHRLHLGIASEGTTGVLFSYHPQLVAMDSESNKLHV